MKINLKPARKKVKNKISRFLIFPLIFKGQFFWLERVIIKRNFNGRNLQITDVIRSKDLIEKEINKKHYKLKVVKEAV